MKRGLFLVLVVIQLSNAQNVKIDSLKLLIPQKTGVEKIDLLRALAYEFIDFDNQSALLFGSQSFNSAVTIGDSLRMVMAGKVMSSALRRSNRPDSAVAIASYAERIAYRNHYEEEREILLNSLGAALQQAAKYDQSLHYLLESLVLREKSGNQKSIAVVLANIGNIYYKLKNYEIALKYYKNSMIVNPFDDENYNLDNLKINMSICTAHLGNLLEARKMISLIVIKCRSNCSDFIGVSCFYTSGFINYKSDSLRNAKQDFLKSYSIAKNTDNHRFIFDNIIYLSKIYIRERNYITAKTYLLEAEKLAKDSQYDLEEIKIYEELCSLYKAQGDQKNLSHYREKYIQLKDSVFSEQHSNNLIQLHSEVAKKENEAKRSSQEQMLNLKDEIIVRQHSINVLAGIISMLLITLVYVLFRVFRNRKKYNALLNKKVAQRTEELNRNHFELSLAIKQRDALVTSLNHDLNTSLESMQTFCFSGSKTTADSNSLRYFTEINTTTATLTKSLSNLLDENLESAL